MSEPTAMENEGHQCTPGTFLIGLDNPAPWPLHAVRPKHSTSPRSHVPTICGTIATLARNRGEFVRGNEFVDRGTLCGECAWFVALEHGTTGQELALRTPSGPALRALQRSGLDPLLYARTAQRLLDLAVDAETDHDTTAAFLGHITQHQPTLLVGEDCPGDCEHTSEDECYGDAPTVACLECSVLNGPWAGEWEGQVHIRVPRCGVLPAVAAHYGVLVVSS